MPIPVQTPADLAPGSDVKELTAHRHHQLVDLSELWRYRELLWFLALRDIQVRYKQTALGALWAMIQPLAMMVVLSYVLRRFLGQAELADPIFLYAGLLPWTFFATAVTASASSLVVNADMLRKIYFPRLLVPLASVGAPLVDFAVAFAVLGGLMLWFGVAPGWSILLLPLLLISAIIAALALGVLMSALSVTYRDFRYVVPFLVSIGYFLSGTMFDVEQAHWLFHLNPISGVIAGFRAAVLDTGFPWLAWGISTISGVFWLLVGLAYFAGAQRRFADVV